MGSLNGFLRLRVQKVWAEVHAIEADLQSLQIFRNFISGTKIWTLVVKRYTMLTVVAGTLKDRLSTD